MPEQWGNWFIATMPAAVLEMAISDTATQLEKLNARLAGADYPNRPQSERAVETLNDLAASLDAEKARRDVG